MADRIAVLVTGMHRSGTSALARTLSLLGASLPDDLVPANPGNPHGHWEPKAFVAFNDRMLADAGSDLYGVADFDPAWFASPRAATFVAEAAALVGTAYGGDPLVVLKDPRTALMLPIWEEALGRQGYDVVHVLPLRHPETVADSLRRRHLKELPYDGWARPRGEAVWLRYTLAAVRGSRGRRRAFVDYGDFLADWRGTMARVATEVGLVWPRLGSGADREVDTFLHENPQAELRRTPVAPPEAGDLDGLDLFGLAAALHATLSQRGDDAPLVDAIHGQYAARMRGTRDLIGAFEALYPLVWHYYEDARRLRETLEIGRRQEGQMQGAVQHLWSTLNRSNDDKSALRLDLTSAARRVHDLEDALEQIGSALKRADAQRDACRAELADLQAQVVAAEAQQEANRRQSAEAAEAALAELAALRASTSWRVTAPLRALLRRARG